MYDSRNTCQSWLNVVFQNLKNNSHKKISYFEIRKKNINYINFSLHEKLNLLLLCAALYIRSNSKGNAFAKNRCSWYLIKWTSTTKGYNSISWCFSYRSYDLTLWDVMVNIWLIPGKSMRYIWWSSSVFSRFLQISGLWKNTQKI